MWEIINPAESKIAVKKVSDIREKGVLIETAKSEDLMFFLNNDNLTQACLVASPLEKKLPRIVTYNLDRNVSIDDLKASITKQ